MGIEDTIFEKASKREKSFNTDERRILNAVFNGEPKLGGFVALLIMLF